MMSHDQIRGTLMALDTVGQQMRFLVSIGYTREQIMETVRETFPDVSDEVLITHFDAATAFHAEVEKDLDRMERLEEIDLAVRAEHDLNQTMHDEDEEDE
jgi:hypothetical protein